MENKQEQIEKIAIVVKHNCNKQGIAKRCPERISNSIYTEGYRKASEVIDEFVERFLNEALVTSIAGEYGRGFLDCVKIFDNIADEMRQEVEK